LLRFARNDEPVRSPDAAQSGTLHLAGDLLGLRLRQSRLRAPRETHPCAPHATYSPVRKPSAVCPRCSRLDIDGGFRFGDLLLDRFNIGVHVVALAAAFALAVPIGWDREKRARSAGLRTFPLVALASCGFVQASESLLVHSPDGMAKVIEGLITGIGFIGGGAILKQGNSVHGTATAASLWATGAIGVSVGLGAYDVAVTIAVFTFLTLRLLTLAKEEGDL
jgi:putative Mg2+ transporter-C (MgtC) family protein